jgi:hypothetical protein
MLNRTLIHRDKLQQLQQKLQDQQLLEDKYQDLKELLTLTQQQYFELSADNEAKGEELEEKSEWYERMLAVENLIYNKNYEDFFSKMPDAIINTMVEYLNWLKVEFLKLSVKKSDEVKDLVYRNGLFTATTSLLSMFAKAKATKDNGKFESDPIS